MQGRAPTVAKGAPRDSNDGRHNDAAAAADVAGGE